MTNLEPTFKAGKILGAFGVQGWLKIWSYCDPRENITHYPAWILTQNGQNIPYALAKAKHQGDHVIAQFRDAAGNLITDRNLAEKLIGAEIDIDRKFLPKLPVGQYYWSELLGLTVKNTDGVLLGTVEDMMDSPAHDIFCVRDDLGKTILIPFVREHIVLEVSLDKQEILVKWEI